MTKSNKIKNIRYTDIKDLPEHMNDLYGTCDILHSFKVKGGGTPDSLVIFFKAHQYQGKVATVKTYIKSKAHAVAISKHLKRTLIDELKIIYDYVFYYIEEGNTTSEDWLGWLFGNIYKTKNINTDFNLFYSILKDKEAA